MTKLRVCAAVARRHMAIVATGVVASAFGCTEPKSYPRPERVWSIGHRGAPLVHAENTLPAFQAAAERGANAVETDLCITSDDFVVLWHDVDPTSARAWARQLGVGPVPYDPDAPPLWSKYRRKVSELTLEELRAYYGYDGTEATVPTLEPFMEWLADESRIEAVFFDVKDDDRAADIMRQLVDQLQRREFAPKALFATNGSVQALREMRQVLDERGFDALKLAHAGTDSILEGAKAAGVRHVSFGRWLYEPMFLYFEELDDLLRAREQGVLDTVVVWTIDEADRQRSLYDFGVDGIMSNHVKRLSRVRRAVLGHDDK